MAATREDVDRWIANAKKVGATHIISVCDTFDYDDYPVYVMPDEKLYEKKKQYDNVNMQKINEVIDVTDLKTAVLQSGFASEEEFFLMVSSVDLSTPAKLVAFERWKDSDGSKTGLEKLFL